MPTYMPSYPHARRDCTRELKVKIQSQVLALAKKRPGTTHICNLIRFNDETKMYGTYKIYILNNYLHYAPTMTKLYTNVNYT